MSTARNPVKTSLNLVTGLGLLVMLATHSAASHAETAAERSATIKSLQVSTKALSATIFKADFEPRDSACDIDSDGDELPDCVETATGVFVDVGNTGTDPQNPDTDGDGLADGIEVVGTPDGVDLPAMGTNPLRRDLLIEYDWFEDAKDCAVHSHAPNANVRTRVKQMFAAANISNPDGSTGINVIQDAGQGGVFSQGNAIADHDANLPGAFDAEYVAIKRANFDSRREGLFRYVVLAHRYNTNSDSSGFAEVIGDDAIVSLYCASSDDNLARTIMHEVGHLLGLHHGGFETCNGKPNYNSLMNYRFQFRGTDAACGATSSSATETFSAGDRLVIDETSIDEMSGVCGDNAIDWNNNGALETGIAFDLNEEHTATCSSALQVLQDYDDWANITFAGLADNTSAKVASAQTVTGCAGAAPNVKH